MTRGVLEFHSNKSWEVLYACVALHNFIRIYDDGDLFEGPLEEEVEEEEQDEEDIEAVNAKWRDDIATAMWEQYESYVTGRH